MPLTKAFWPWVKAFWPWVKAFLAASKDVGSCGGDRWLAPKSSLARIEPCDALQRPRRLHGEGDDALSVRVGEGCDSCEHG